MGVVVGHDCPRFNESASAWLRRLQVAQPSA
jgi:hypothetical protein